jgi:two-component system, cell cycle sensor histidine kinase and response regulator CckA
MARADETPAESSQRLRAAMEASLDSLLVLASERDGAGEITDFIIVDVNGRAETMLQIPRADLVGHRLCEVLPINRSAGFFEKYKRVAETGIPLQEEFLLPDTHVPGAWYCHQVVPCADGILINNRDITVVKQADAELRATEARLRLALSGADLGTWDWDIPTGHVSFDERWARMLGYEPSDLSPDLQTWSDLVHPDDLGAVTAALEAHLAGDTDGYETVHRVRHRDGNWVWILDKGRVIERDDEGRPRRACGTHLDITASKQAEQELVESRAQVYQVQKLECVGRLAGGVAHDLNNLLTPILGYSELLLRDPTSSQRTRASVEEIMQAGQRARDLVRQLLAFSRKQALEFDPIDLNDLLNRFIGLLRRTIREDIAIRFETTAALPVVHGDAGQLEQVVMNLAVNAQDAMPAGGVLTIETAVLDLDGSAADGRSGPHVRLTIRDTGTGMTAAALAHLFEPFFTTKEQGKGTGLGLATVYGIVTQHGGTIGVDTAPDRGTSFTILLPVSADPVVGAKRPQVPTTNTSGAETILLVEDHEQVRGLAKDILATHGYRVLAAASGDGALEIMRRHDGPLHLLLTDVVMPGLSGKDLFKALSADHPHLKVVYMSGYADEVIVHHGVLEPGLAFVQKPFEVRTLLGTVRAVLDQTTVSPRSSSR